MNTASAISLGQHVVMGVSGSGKTSVASLLAGRTGGVFLDADDFHPPLNKSKMAAAIPLTDEDRWPWLELLNRELKEQAGLGQTTFLACSALRQAYRDRLAEGVPGVRFIYLKGSKELVRKRMEIRTEHFMPAALIDSQFAILEEPKDAIVVDITRPIPVIVENVLAQLSGNGPE